LSTPELLPSAFREADAVQGTLAEAEVDDDLRWFFLSFTGAIGGSVSSRDGPPTVQPTASHCSYRR
jgi:hypothetical protein